jgi:hypothetical protein
MALFNTIETMWNQKKGEFVLSQSCRSNPHMSNILAKLPPILCRRVENYLEPRVIASANTSILQESSNGI